jgi:hypothetical protein
MREPRGLGADAQKELAAARDLFQVNSIIAKPEGKFHDQGDAKWIVIRRPLRGHKDMHFGQPTPGLFLAALRAYLVV